MINLDYITREDTKPHNSNWPKIPEHPYRILIIGGTGSGKTSELLNLIKQQNDNDYSIIDKVCLYAKIYLKQNINILFNKCKNKDLKDVKDPKTYIEYANNMQGVYKNIEDNVMY